MSTELARLEAAYRKRRAEIRSDPSLSWEKKELAIRRLGEEYDKARVEVTAERPGSGAGRGHMARAASSPGPPEPPNEG
jgi:hypothetical protein